MQPTRFCSSTGGGGETTDAQYLNRVVKILCKAHVKSGFLNKEDICYLQDDRPTLEALCSVAIRMSTVRIKPLKHTGNYATTQ